MEKPIRYSEIKPIVAFARKHWSDPQRHEPFVSFLDTSPHRPIQLRATRRQVFNYGKQLLQRGDTPQEVLTVLEAMRTV